MAISNDDLNVQLQQTSALIADFGLKFAAYTNGVVGGGPNNDGNYPLPTSLGAYVMAKCPAQLAADALQPKFRNVKMTSGSAFTLDPTTDKSAIIALEAPNPATGVGVNLPPKVPAGWTATIIQNSTGRHFFNLNGGSSMYNRQNFTKTAGQGSPMTALCTGQKSDGSSVWFLFGDMGA